MINKNINFIFDLDGVIFDSKSNMQLSWNKTSAKFKLKKNFEEYFKNIGVPFNKILKNIGIKKNIKKIKLEYKKNSLKYLKKVKLYSGIKKFILFLEKKNISYCIVTSKDLTRSKLLLNKYKFHPKSIHCPSQKYKGKPSPDLINACIKKNNFQKKYCFYIGDTIHDYEAAKNAKINFIFANYGYGKKIKKYKNVINKPSDLFNFV